MPQLLYPCCRWLKKAQRRLLPHPCRSRQPRFRGLRRSLPSSPHFLQQPLSPPSAPRFQLLLSPQSRLYSWLLLLQQSRLCSMRQHRFRGLRRSLPS